MKKILIILLTLIIAFSSFAMISATEPVDANERLQDLFLPGAWIDKNISEVNGSTSLSAFSEDHSLEFGVDFNTDIDPKNLTEIDRHIYQDGNTLLEVVKMGSKEYRVFAKCDGTNNISSQADKLEAANDGFFMFNKLNYCNPIEIS